MARQPVNVEFFNMLKDLGGFSTNAEMARACELHQVQVSNYLSGALVPQRRVLRRSIHNLVAWDVTSLTEKSPLPTRRRDIPPVPGLYVLFDSGGNVLYLGKATDLRSEVYQTLRRRVARDMRFGPNLHKSRPTFRSLSHSISLYQINSARSRSNFEALMLRIFSNQTHNTNIGHF